MEDWQITSHSHLKIHTYDDTIWDIGRVRSTVKFLCLRTSCCRIKLMHGGFKTRKSFLILSMCTRWAFCLHFGVCYRFCYYNLETPRTVFLWETRLHSTNIRRRVNIEQSFVKLRKRCFRNIPAHQNAWLCHAHLGHLLQLSLADVNWDWKLSPKPYNVSCSENHHSRWTHSYEIEP